MSDSPLPKNVSTASAKKSVETCLDMGVIPRPALRAGAGPLEHPTVSISPRAGSEGPMGRL